MTKEELSLIVDVIILCFNNVLFLHLLDEALYKYDVNVLWISIFRIKNFCVYVIKENIHMFIQTVRETIIHIF